MSQSAKEAYAFSLSEEEIGKGDGNEEDQEEEPINYAPMNITAINYFVHKDSAYVSLLSHKKVHSENNIVIVHTMSYKCLP